MLATKDTLVTGTTRTDSFNNTVQEHYKNNIKCQLNTYVVFDKILYARGANLSADDFKEKVVKKSSGCWCGTRTYIIPATVNQLASVYSMDIDGYFNKAEAPIALQNGLAKQDTTTQRGEASYDASSYVNGLVDVNSYIQNIRKYELNVTYLGEDFLVQPPTSLNYVAKGILTGIGVLDTTIVSDTNKIYWGPNSTIFDNGMYNLDKETTINRKTVITRPEYSTGITQNSFSSLLTPNKQITAEDIDAAIKMVFDDWHTNLEQNKIVVDAYFCHYNCYSDEVEREEKSSGGGGSTSDKCSTSVIKEMTDKWHDEEQYERTRKIASSDVKEGIDTSRWTWHVYYDKNGNQKCQVSDNKCMHWFHGDFGPTGGYADYTFTKSDDYDKISGFTYVGSCTISGKTKYLGEWFCGNSGKNYLKFENEIITCVTAMMKNKGEC